MSVPAGTLRVESVGDGAQIVAESGQVVAVCQDCMCAEWLAQAANEHDELVDSHEGAQAGNRVLRRQLEKLQRESAIQGEWVGTLMDTLQVLNLELRHAWNECKEASQ